MRVNGAWIKRYRFYVQKHITPCSVVTTSLLVRDNPLRTPASVKQVYFFGTTMGSSWAYTVHHAVLDDRWLPVG